MKQTLTIRVAKKQLEQLRAMANEEDESISAIIRRFIDECIKKSKVKSKKA